MSPFQFESLPKWISAISLYNLRETNSIAISSRTKDSFGTSHLCGESHVSERRSVVTWRPCSWDYRKTDCQVTANKEGSGEVNKNITTKTRAFTTDKKETETENWKFQRKTRLIRVLHRCAHPPQATKFDHFVILFQKDGKVIYYESIISYYISLSFPFFRGNFSLYADILYNVFFIMSNFAIVSVHSWRSKSVFTISITASTRMRHQHMIIAFQL